MFTRIGFLALWLIASSAAVAVAWAGVSVVDDEIVNPAPAAVLSTDPHPASVDAGPAAVAEPPSNAAVDAGAPAAEPLDAQSTVSTVPTTTVTTASPTAQSPSTPPPPVTTPTIPTTQPTVPTTTTAPSPTTTTPTTTTTVPPTFTQTFNLQGGTAVVDFSAAAVTVQLAVPNPGFSVKIEPESPGWKVEFRSEDHRSRVDVWWADGPRSEISEEAEDS